MDQTDSDICRSDIDIIEDRHNFHRFLYHPFGQYHTRLETFKLWPKYHSPSPQELARFGFVYSNKSGAVFDQVRCFWCDVTLQNWKPTDRAHIEHLKWSPDCKFVKYLCQKFKADNLCIHCGSVTL